MEREGKLLTCDRCGLTLFVGRSGTQYNMIDGYVEESPTYLACNPNWDYLNIYPEPSDIHTPKEVLANSKMNFTQKLLCPKCRDEFADLMYKFWRIIEV